MRYQVLIVASARKEIKKLDIQVRDKVLEVIEALSINPMAGEPLRGVFKDMRSYHFACQGVQYRVAYQVREKELLVLILMAGSRENFYEELVNRIKQ